MLTDMYIARRRVTLHDWYKIYNWCLFNLGDKPTRWTLGTGSTEIYNGIRYLHIIIRFQNQKDKFMFEMIW